MGVSGVGSNAQSCMDILVAKNNQRDKTDEENRFTELLGAAMDAAAPVPAADNSAEAAASAGAAAPVVPQGAPPTIMVDGEECTLAPVISDKLEDLIDDPAIAGKSLGELEEGLDEAFQKHAERATEPYREAGVPMITIMAGGMSMYSITGGIKLPQLSREEMADFNTVSRVWSDFHAEVERRQQPEYQEMARNRENTLNRLLEERRESGEAEAAQKAWDVLCARAALVRAGERIEGFAEEYAADPSAAATKHAYELDEIARDISISWRDGELSYNY